ncbi:MAG: succinyl-diaminopimelate desuccinylase [Rickettsiales bacterium]|nr:succinyl-diaminopimelate desuccinylase [Pseudomonadota bacterium]MDA0965364.1 succinyl-diaminopimelate desuccinylase [Pseudomonadota bacterium]MDG4544292.1 succinyl-diaminopimelate desuccinylase [Rickettsiales bacterium]MDG4544863.1 succinyl-diaminopimelate desuccinylase [Rickettsiales bacterium]MDG4546985.1 succinyl-diaminopimelate desuccinylase [Rickettsiales bacterium]
MTIDALELSSKLIKCPSITPVDAGVMDVLQEALEGLGFQCMRMPFSQEGFEDTDNLYARLGNIAPNVCFAGHTDVVPPGNLEDWTSDPFKPEVRDGILYGRGTVDMKCAIACFVAAVSEYLKNNNPKISISLLITGDEEGIAVNGTKKMLQQLEKQGEKIDYCIVGEPTNPEKLGEMIKIGRRGSVGFTLSVLGKQGHVAYPNLADNPITRMVKILHALNENVLDNGTEFFQPSNLEVTTIDVANDATNVIPAMAKAKFNIRFNDKHTSDKLIKWVEGVCDSFCKEGNAKYKLESRVSGEAFLTQPGDLSNALAKAVEEVTGMKPELSTTGGTSDARFIKDYCSVVEFGLMNKTAHKVDECVAVDDIYKLKDVYLKFLESY